MILLSAALCLADSEEDKTWDDADDNMIRAELSNYAEDFSGLALTMLEEKAYKAATIREQIAILGWAYRTVPFVRDLQFEVNPAIGLVDLILLTTRMNNYMATEQATRYYGSMAPELALLIQDANAKAWAEVAQILSGKEYLDFYTKVYEWVHKHPMTGYIGRQSVIALAADRDLVTGLEKAAPSFFLGDLSTQLQDTTVQMHILNLTAERITDQVEWMPVYASWIATIFMLDDIGESSIADAVDSISQLSDELAPLQALSSDFDRVATGIEELQALQANLERLAGDIEKLTVMVEPGIIAMQGLDEKTALMNNQLSSMSSEAEKMSNMLDSQKSQLEIAANSLVTLADFTKKSEDLVWTIAKALLVVVVGFFICLLIYSIVIARLRKS